MIVALVCVTGQNTGSTGAANSMTGSHSGATGNVAMSGTGTGATGATGNSNSAAATAVNLEKPMEDGIGSKVNKRATNAGFLIDREDQQHFEDELAYAEKNDLNDLTNSRKQEILTQNACQMNLTALKEDAHNAMIERD